MTYKYVKKYTIKTKIALSIILLMGLGLICQQNETIKQQNEEYIELTNELNRLIVEVEVNE